MRNPKKTYRNAEKKKTHLLSAFFVVPALDFAPFMARSVGEELRSVRIDENEAKNSENRRQNG